MSTTTLNVKEALHLHSLILKPKNVDFEKTRFPKTGTVPNMNSRGATSRRTPVQRGGTVPNKKDKFQIPSKSKIQNPRPWNWQVWYTLFFYVLSITTQLQSQIKNNLFSLFFFLFFWILKPEPRNLVLYHVSSIMGTIKKISQLPQYTCY